jgi:hypothetical protein
LVELIEGILNEEIVLMKIMKEIIEIDLVYYSYLKVLMI